MGMELQITGMTGLKEAAANRQSAGFVSGKRKTESREAPRIARSEGVREKMLQEADGATVAISAEGLGLVEKREEEKTLREEREWQRYQEMLEKSKEAAEAQKEGFGDLAKAFEIARRILNGDIVPPQDEAFLMEFNSEIYMRVKSMAERKEDPEEYDSLLEEEKDEKGGMHSIKKGIPESGHPFSADAPDGVY